ncbi:MAG: SufE family protein [Clostridium sp.]|nr:SufE family protein [Prevotella sp.]MCM1428900.1 SufE family protein [Clostridium sp.]MCM1475279.1 SufE family protein [Muribaculaceae bacterium]
MSIDQIQDEIIDEFADLTDWMDRYAYIIELGQALPPLPESAKTPENLIEGCQSRVWITANLEDGKIHFEADSDALIVKGIVSLLLRVLSDHTPREILDAQLYFIAKIGLSDHLSPTRSNGLLAMVKQMKNYAIAFQAISEAGK